MRNMGNQVEVSCPVHTRNARYLEWDLEAGVRTVKVVRGYEGEEGVFEVSKREVRLVVACRWIGKMGS